MPSEVATLEKTVWGLSMYSFINVECRFRDLRSVALSGTAFNPTWHLSPLVCYCCNRRLSWAGVAELGALGGV
jgi:hypothetical protein